MFLYDSNSVIDCLYATSIECDVKLKRTDNKLLLCIVAELATNDNDGLHLSIKEIAEKFNISKKSCFESLKRLNSMNIINWYGIGATNKKTLQLSPNFLKKIEISTEGDQVC